MAGPDYAIPGPQDRGDRPAVAASAPTDGGRETAKPRGREEDKRVHTLGHELGHPREVSPEIPSGEKVERTDQPAPFLEDQRHEPQVIAYYGGTWVREPLERRRGDVFEATVTFPHDGSWRIGPFFYNGDFRWAERKGVPVRDADAAPSDLPTRRFDLEVAAEGDPIDAPTWLKPIAFAFLGALFLAALWLVVVQLRIVRRGGIAAA